MRDLELLGVLLFATGCILPDYTGMGDGGAGGASAASYFPSDSTAAFATNGEPASTTGTDAGSTGTDGGSTSSVAVGSSSSDGGSTSTDAVGSSSSDGGSTSTVAAGSSSSDGGSTSSGAVGASSSDASSTSTVAASTSTGGGECLPALPPCEGTTPFDFGDQDELEERFDVDQPVARVQGNRLRLDPEDAEAVLKSKAEAELSGDCAIWVKIHSSDAMGSTGIGLGNGALSGSPLRIERRGEILSAVANDAQQGSAAFAEEEMSFIRLRGRDDGVYLDYGADTTCWKNLSGPHPAGESKVILFHEGPGKADLDDYCLD